MNKILIAIVVTLLTSSYSMAEDQIENLKTKNLVGEGEILDLIIKLKDKNIDSFVKKMKIVQQSSQRYIAQREEDCSGVYFTVTTNEKGEKSEQKKKLSHKEKKLCKYLLVNFQIKVNHEIYKLRHAFLVKLHVNQLKQLEEMNRKNLAELESLADKFK